MRGAGIVVVGLLVWPSLTLAAFIPENQRNVLTVTFNVSPRGDDGGDGSSAQPFKTLARAQQAVRAVNAKAHAIVLLGDGVYRLAEPLQFAAADGGQNGTTVTWQAARGASPVIAGSVSVGAWKLHDAARQIYVADIPSGTDARQVWINDHLAKRASIEIPRSAVEFTAEGIQLLDAKYDYLAHLPAQQRLEVQSTGWFTNRLCPVQDVVGRKLVMQQPAWDNNTWGYDALNAPVGAETAHLYLNNSLAFLSERRWGCREFEERRNDWSQMPAAVQVSAAERVVFDRDVFAHLGQIALGIGNNDEAHASGIGLGARSIQVTRSVFVDVAGGAIMAGGISRDAHHPSDPGMANRSLLIANNRICGVSQVYLDNSAILSTYVDGALILHNDISDAPYDGIDIGWGWGVNDVGGSEVYRSGRRGYYDFPANLVYDSPTMHRRVLVAYNRIHGIKRVFHDGGAIYNLSASPDTVIAENYIYDIPGRIALYLDEGSRYITVRENVVDGAGVWLTVNTLNDYRPLRASTDNKAVGNWYTDSKITGSWDRYNNNTLEANRVVAPGAWPAEARAVMENAGIEKDAGVPQCGSVR